MTAFVRLLPGLIGLVVAWAVVRLAIWLGLGSDLAQLVLLALVWIVVTLLADHAFRAYGQTPP